MELHTVRKRSSQQKKLMGVIPHKKRKLNRKQSSSVSQNGANNPWLEGMFTVTAEEDSLNKDREEKGDKAEKESITPNQKEKYGKAKKNSINPNDKEKYEKAKNNCINPNDKEKYEKAKTDALSKNGIEKGDKAEEDSLNQNKKEKVNWQEVKESKKALKQLRKQKKIPAKEVVKEAKRLFEIGRSKSLTREQRRKIVCDIYKVLKGHMKEVVYKHDMTRILQLLIRLSPINDKKSIWSELKPEVPKMIRSPYAIHTAKWLIDTGDSEIRKEFIALLKGNVLALLKNKLAAPLIDHIYKKYASYEDKSLMRQELTYFSKPTMSGIIEIIQTKGTISPFPSERKFVDRLLDEANEKEDEFLMISARATLEMLIKKNVVVNSLVQSILCDYFGKCSPTERETFMNNLQPVLQTILDYGQLDTVYVVILFAQYLWYGSNKEKKWLVKKLHEKMPDICFKQHAFFLLLTVFESVDDTVLLKKTLLKDITSNMKKITDNFYGWKVIMHILAPRSSCHFPLSCVALLTLGDRLAVKKKEDAVRNAEILEPVIEPLVEEILGALDHWLLSGCQTIMIFEAISVTNGTLLENVLNKIAEFICCSKPEMLNGRSRDFNRYVEWLIKQLVKSDKTRLEKEKVSFSSVFLSKMTEENVMLWVQSGRGAFIFVKLIETEIPSVKRNVKSLFNSKIKKVIQCSAAGKLLRSKLRELKSDDSI